MNIILIFLLSSMLIQYIIPFNNIPEPTGKFNVGTKVYEWYDKSRKEWFTKNETDHRRLVVQIWYPTNDIGEEKKPYLDFPDKRIEYISKRLDISPNFIKDIQKVYTNSISNASIIKKNKFYPLLLFSHGLGGMRMQNTVQMEELASRGYFVVSVDHTFDANITVFLDGSTAEFRSYLRDDASEEEFWEVRLPQVNTRASDISFIIDKITYLIKQNDIYFRNINMNKIGVFGHSFGGATAIVAAYKDNRIDACLNLDGWMEPVIPKIIQSGLNIPFLYIGQEKWDDTPLNHVKLDSLIISSNGRKEIIEGAKHFDYSDTPHLNRAAKIFNLSGNINVDSFRQKLNSEILAFFNKNVKNIN